MPLNKDQKSVEFEVLEYVYKVEESTESGKIGMYELLRGLCKV